MQNNFILRHPAPLFQYNSLCLASFSVSNDSENISFKGRRFGVAGT